MLNPAEQDHLQVLLKDELLFKTVEKVIHETIMECEPKVSEINDDILLGQKYRAYDTSKEILAQAIIKLMSFKQVEGSKDNFNKHR